MKPKKKCGGQLLIIMLHLGMRIASMASAYATEEGSQFPCDRRWFLSRGEVPAARKDRPS
jgi:hypothetical protein